MLSDSQCAVISYPGNLGEECIQQPYVSAKKKRPWVLFIAPSLVTLFILAGWPLGRTIYLSFTDARLMNMSLMHWTGLKNYIWLWHDPLWWRVVQNTLCFASLSVFLEAFLGLGLACLLHKNFRGRNLLRVVVLIPWAIPTIVSAQIWAWMFHDIYGIINHFLLHAGLIKSNLAWLGEGHLAMIAAIVADVWKTTPFVSLLLLAGLQMIPEDYYEVARIDGVSPLKVFFKVTLPLLKPVLAVAVVFRLLDALRIFDLIYILTHNASSTMSMSIYARQQIFDFQNIGQGSAASTSLFILVSFATVFYLILNRKEESYATKSL